MSQLGPDSLAALQRIAQSYQQSAAGKAALGTQPDDDDEVPDLVSFDEAGIDEDKKDETDEADEADAAEDKKDDEADAAKERKEEASA